MCILLFCIRYAVGAYGFIFFMNILVNSFLITAFLRSQAYMFLLFVTAGVHDSYWTHAGDVEQMNSLLREKFVELYSQPVLENVSQECLCDSMLRFEGKL